MAILGAEKEAMANWSELPSDMLQLISKKLPELSDFIRFRAVCQKWRSFVPISDLPPLLPWLVIIPFPSNYKQHTIFYSLSSHKFFTTPDAPNDTFPRSSLRYLLLNSDSTLPSLFNPVTNHVVHLPPINIKFFDQVHSDGDSLFICRTSGNPYLEIFHWQLGAAKWGRIYVRDSADMLAYYKGFLFNVHKFKWITKVFEARTGEYVLEIPPPVWTSDFTGFNYLIKSSEGIFGVCRLLSASGKKDSFHVYRLNSENGIYEWTKVSNIGDCILLLDKFFGKGLSVSAKELGLKGNCIYFQGNQYVNGLRFTVFYRYDMKDNTVVEVAWLSEPFGSNWYWFVPSLQ
ncbi:hypothetical protein LUZ61_014704 [Rhynchospora tenuis]|uniref:F-box domain-containing protein n=1 Tax=Rhynchospora tenuis TaxID=198213 RepID=A0AAD5WB79_9POAL|nr:hypothetical protein LUZ61_014704 [Rhynchospora tenuis]